MRSILHDRGTGWEGFEGTLLLHIPHLISFSYQLGSSASVVKGLLRDIAKRRAELIRQFETLTLQERAELVLHEARENQLRKVSVESMWRKSGRNVIAVRRISEDVLAAAKKSSGRHCRN